MADAMESWISKPLFFVYLLPGIRIQVNSQPEDPLESP